MGRPAKESHTRLRAARKARGLTLAEVARLADVKLGIVQVWEAGTHIPRAYEALKVARAMDLDLEDLAHDFEIQRREEKVIA